MKTNYSIVLLILITISFSCKKSHTCTCKTSRTHVYNSTGSSFSTTDYSSFENVYQNDKITKKNFKRTHNCYDNTEEQYGSDGTYDYHVTDVTKCTLK